MKHSDSPRPPDIYWAVGLPTRNTVRERIPITISTFWLPKKNIPSRVRLETQCAIPRLVPPHSYELHGDIVKNESGDDELRKGHWTLSGT